MRRSFGSSSTSTNSRSPLGVTDEVSTTVRVPWLGPRDSPIDGIPAQDSTEVLVWYSSRAMYFGVRAFEPHGDVHYKLADRDKIDADDNIQIVLTPFLHSRQALVFAVNPLGVQEDGTMTEGVGKSRSFNTGTTQTGRPATDLSPDFVYESQGHVTPYGYEVVVRIPFRSIKYQADDPQDWGVNIVRKVQHSGLLVSPPRRSSASRARSSASRASTAAPRSTSIRS